jgi:hypothetical protein
MSNLIAEAFDDWLGKFLPKMQFVIVAQTKIRPCNQSQRWIAHKREEMSQVLENTMKSVSLNLYPNDPKLPFRKRFEYRPYTFTTVEGLSPNMTQEKTMHFNMLVGNLPEDFTKQKLSFFFLRDWVGRYRQSDDVWIHTVDELVQSSANRTHMPIQVIGRYFLKDAYDNKSNACSTEGTFDTNNLWLPHEALS